MRVWEREPSLSAVDLPETLSRILSHSRSYPPMSNPADAQQAEQSPAQPMEILTPEQLAERLQVGVNWVYEKSRGEHSGKPLPVLRCGRYLRF